MVRQFITTIGTIIKTILKQDTSHFHLFIRSLFNIISNINISNKMIFSPIFRRKKGFLEAKKKRYSYLYLEINSFKGVIYSFLKEKILLWPAPSIKIIFFSTFSGRILCITNPSSIGIIQSAVP